MQDISNREDIHFIITKFYEKLVADTEMLPFFDAILKQNHLAAHVDVIADFWNDILFYTTSYQNNVLQKHLSFDAKVTFKKAHFEKWLYYLTKTVQDFFKGQNAQNMLDRANSIAQVMQVKMKLYD